MVFVMKFMSCNTKILTVHSESKREAGADRYIYEKNGFGERIFYHNRTKYTPCSVALEVKWEANDGKIGSEWNANANR